MPAWLAPMVGLAFALVVSPPAHAPQDRSHERVAEWVTDGPWGADVRALAAAPTQPGMLYAGTSRGVFRSGDGGREWTETSALPVADTVVTVAVTASSSPQILAGTASNGLFRSLDGGESWDPVAPEMFAQSQGEVAPLVADPNDGLTIYAAVAGMVFKSVDGGEIWNPTMIPPGVPRALAIAPSASRVIYVGGYLVLNQFDPSSGVAVSEDGGVSWRATPSTVFGGEIVSLAVDPTDPSIAYAGAMDSGIYKTTDTGSTWSVSAPVTLAYSPGALAVDRIDPRIVYAVAGSAVLISTDAGQTWTSTSPDASDPFNRYFTVLLADPHTANRAYLGQYNGVFRTEDRATSWSESSTGMDDIAVSSLAESGAGLLAGSSLGLFRSAGPGSGWLQGYGVWATSVASDPADPAVAYAAGDKISKSIDGGITWTQKYSGYIALSSLAIDPGDRDRVYAGRTVLVGAHGIYLGGGVVWSSDGGEHWTEPEEALLEDVRSVAVSPGDGTVLAGTRDGLLRSTDHGLSWSESGLSGLDVRAVRFASSPSVVAYAATSSGAYRSDDAGANWVAAGLAEESVTALAIDPRDPSTAYAGTEGPGISVTRNGGRTWSAVSVREMRGSTISALSAGPGDRDLIASTDRGVFTVRSRAVRPIRPR
jgi:photosystem II stability/assembly factor-like uncharacterized protein